MTTGSVGLLWSLSEVLYNTALVISDTKWEFRVSFRQKKYRSGTVNSKSFVSKVLLRIKWKFELN